MTTTRDLSQKTMDEFFFERGLPYRLRNASQVLWAIDTRGLQNAAVVVEVSSPKAGKPRFYVGYHDPDEADNLQKSLRRVRKYSVIRAVVISPDPDSRYIQYII